MIAGIGVDMVFLPRWEAVLKRWEDKILDRLFTDHEKSICSQRMQPAQHYAARFAAKEALFKAMTHHYKPNVFRFRDVEVKVGENAPAPQFDFHGQFKAWLSQQAIIKTHLSLSHDGDYAIAYVILEKQ